MKSTAQSTAQTMPKQVATHLAPAFDVLSADFDAYVKKNDTDRWLVFSDYVLRNKQRKTSTIAFTVVPGGNHFESNIRKVASAAKSDFKSIGIVTDEMLELLGNGSFYTFCFVAVQDQLPQFATIDNARAFIDAAAASLKKSLDVRGHAAAYQSFRALQQEALSKSFNFRLLGDILFISTLAAFIALQLGRRTKVDRFAWCSDRDKLVEAYEGFAYTFLAIAVSEYWQEIERGSSGPMLGANPPHLCTDRAWFDCMTRIPDYFAGAVAGWGLSHELDGLPLKYRQVLGAAAEAQSTMRIIRVGNMADQ